MLNIDVKFEQISFMLDFEKSARKAIKKVFPKSNI